MVGQGVLRECLLDPDVTSVLSIARGPSGQQNPKLKEIIRTDFLDFSSIENELSGLDACFYCLGVSSLGKTEERYRHITYDFTLAAARTLARLNPNMTFIYVSGKGTDSSERGRTMWARVKGATENALLRLPLKAYMFRPGLIVPLHRVKSRTKLYRILYALLHPILRFLYILFPQQVTTTEQIGRAMVKIARDGASEKILESADINNV